MTVDIDCSNQPADPWGIHPEPDISGLGVFIGFVSTSYILLFIVVVYYIFGYDPTSNPFGTAEQGTLTRARPNPFDQLVLRVARRTLRLDSWQWLTSYKNEHLAAVFDKCVINMADIQIVNGLAILIAGLVLLDNSLSALHWKIIVYLSWFSCTTNLSALIFLRSYLIRNPFERIWRLGSTFVLLVMLIVALVPTGHFFWRVEPDRHIEDAAPSAYAKCYFKTNFKDDSFAGKNSMLLSILLLVFSYTVRIFKLHRGCANYGLKTRSLSTFLVQKCLDSASRLQGMIGKSSFVERLASNMIVAAHFVICIWLDIFTSMASDIFWLIISITWGSLKTTELRDIIPNADTNPNWSFGQVLAVLLVLGPILVLVRSGREVFVPVNRETSQASNVSSMQEASVVAVGHEALQTDMPRTAFELNTPRPNEPTVSGILEPNLYIEYYENSAWMCWAPAICLNFTLLMTVLLLSLRDDPVSAILNFLLWLVIEQGAMIQILIVIGFYVSAVKKRFMIHAVICGYLASIFYLTFDAPLNGVFQLTPIWFLAATFGTFLFALIGARLSRIARTVQKVVVLRFSAASVAPDSSTPSANLGEA